MHCPIVRKFGRLVQYGYPEAAEWLKSISGQFKIAYLRVARNWKWLSRSNTASRTGLTYVGRVCTV